MYAENCEFMNSLYIRIRFNVDETFRYKLIREI